jgi:hypothetical protein
MRGFNFGAALILMVASLPARAEFVLQGTAAPVAPAETANAGSRIASRAINLKPAPRFPSVTGFGSQVPLGFAVRQIVPASVRVRYADGVDRDGLVDWSGGKPWNEILVRAVKPLGLHVQATPAAVLISP